MRTENEPLCARSRREAGFALILALLALMLLTFLGLTLTTTTSTELQIATNYRWSRQAYYNAEAGIEAGKRLLQTVDWATTLPAARGGTWTTATGLSQAAPTVPAVSSSATRNFENRNCDAAGGAQGYGIVFGDGTSVYENVSSIFGDTLNGTFTIWIRRPTPYAGGTYSDYSADNDRLILTSEGTAPYRVNVTGPAAANRAVRIMEVLVTRAPTGGVCGTFAGQAGTSAEGSNFAACAPLGDDSLDSAFGAGVSEIDASVK